LIPPINNWNKRHGLSVRWWELCSSTGLHKERNTFEEECKKPSWVSQVAAYGWAIAAELVEVAGTLHLIKASLGSGGLWVKHPACEFDFGSLELTMKVPRVLEKSVSVCPKTRHNAQEINIQQPL
jgi:hypothetical protein